MNSVALYNTRITDVAFSSCINTTRVDAEIGLKLIYNRMREGDLYEYLKFRYNISKENCEYSHRQRQADGTRHVLSDPEYHE